MIEKNQRNIILFLFANLMISCSAIHLTPSNKIEEIQFDKIKINDNFQFIYQNKDNAPELKEIKALYNLDSITNGSQSEFQKMLSLLNWTNSRWKHSGSNQPSKPSTLTILKEAQTGKKFRCVEYGIVLKSVLASKDFKARTLGIKTKDVEITRIGAGHVLTEVWSNELQKWCIMDAQFNIAPTLNEIPLNGVEFQNAIINKEKIKLIDLNGEVSEKRRKKYLRFISKYLFYFDYKFDQRELPYDSLFKVNNKAVLMLVPINARTPKKFQRKYKMDYLEYTNSLRDFYKKPI